MPKAFAAEFFDASEQETALPGWEQRFLQLAPKRYRGQVDYLVMPGISVMRERVNATIAQTVTAPKDTVSFVFTVNEDAHWRIDAAPHHGAICSVITGGQEMVSVCPGGYDIVIVTIQSDRLGWDMTRAPKLQMLSGPLRAECLQWLLGLLYNGKSGVSGLIDLLPDIVVEQLGNLYFTNTSPRPERVSGAADFPAFKRLQNHVSNDDAAHSVASLAQATGMTHQSVHETVRNTLGINANAWLKQLRLDGARRDLLQAASTGRTVSEIALQWRFWHLGRFAEYYGAHFHETPSETRRGARIGRARIPG